MTAETIIAAVLAEGNIARFVASGDSMYPAICSGDKLSVERVELTSLRRGDVVLARLDRGLTAHRIVHIDGETITTRGDNCSEDDAPFPFDRVLGRVCKVPFGVRRLAAAFKRRLQWKS